MAKKYKSNNLDEAAFLTLQGYLPRVRRTGSMSAEFSFELDRGAEHVLQTFWKGEATVQLARWLSTRQALKHETMKQVMRLHVESAGKTLTKSLPIAVGAPYWYREGVDVLHALFGTGPMHIARLKDGNVYPTREDAAMKRNPLTV